jgi:DNA-directed RNA polymerase subunit RPC12/RpoP
MQIYHFICKSCGYETKLPLGSSDLDQILTDTNLDYAEYHLFICKKEAKFVHADIHDKEFDGKCPSDGSDLMETEEMPPVKCPRCNHASLVTEETGPMEESSSSTST